MKLQNLTTENEVPRLPYPSSRLQRAALSSRRGVRAARAALRPGELKAFLLSKGNVNQGTKKAVRKTKQLKFIA